MRPYPAFTRLPRHSALLTLIFFSAVACVGAPSRAPAETPTAASTATGAPTPTLTSTETPSPTGTSTPTPTPTPTATPTPSYLDWPIVYSDGFDFYDDLFPIVKKNGGFYSEDISIKGGKYLVKMSSQRILSWWQPISGRNLGDFYLSIEVKTIIAPEKADYGLVFRKGQDDLYYFCINASTRQYEAGMFLHPAWTLFTIWEDSDRIDPAASNQIAVLAQGSRYTLFINGEAVDGFEDDSLKTGMVGLGLELYQAGEYLELEFDNFEVRAPKTGG